MLIRTTRIAQHSYVNFLNHATIEGHGQHMTDISTSWIPIGPLLPAAYHPFPVAAAEVPLSLFERVLI